MSYIEREAVLDRLAKVDLYPHYGFTAAVQLGVDHAIQCVKEALAADVAEVRHGRWIELDECANEGVYCSVCHKKVYKIDYAWSNNPVKMKSPYCPNCGARMDKEDAEGGRG